jgi:hypothetical protein
MYGKKCFIFTQNVTQDSFQKRILMGYVRILLSVLTISYNVPNKTRFELI